MIKNLKKTQPEEYGHVDGGQCTLINFPEGSLTNLNVSISETN